MRAPHQFRHLPLVLALQAAFTLAAQAADVTIVNGSTKQTLSSGTLTVNGTLAVAGDKAVNVKAGTSALVNNGTISSTGGKKTVDLGEAGITFSLTNNGTISSDNVAVRVDKDAVAYAINNQGTISVNGAIGDGKNYAIKLNPDASAPTTGNTLVNGSASNTDATITSNAGAAIKLGSNLMLINYGYISSTSKVNTSCPDYLAADCDALNGGDGAPKSGDGISIDDGDEGGANGNIAILNYGKITGTRHGIDGGSPMNTTADANLIGARQLVAHVGATGVTFDRTDVNGNVTTGVTIANPVVINYAGGVITGNNGSGVGFDGHGVVFNHGTIVGNYAGAGNVYDHLGGGETVNNGDGDGVDIDGVAYIENWGAIKGTGAGGLDSGGNLNGGDGIAAGGGTIINHAGAVIYGQSKGILIDDGADGTTAAVRGTADATGSAAYIVNAGTITGEKKVAVGLVGNFADALINTGTITGGAQTTRLGENNSTVAGAAVQMGAGEDTLINYGRIEGKNGFAIDMGDGDDDLQLRGGAVVGSIAGGAGSDTLTTAGTQTFVGGKLSGFENFVVESGSTTFDYALGAVNSVAVNAGATLAVNGAFSTAGDLTVGGTLKSGTQTGMRTVNVGGDFSLGAGGVLETGVGADNTSDKIAVTGTATLASGATLQPVAKSFVKNGSSYTIVSASTLTADATQLKVVDTAAIDYSLQQNGNDLVLTAHRTGADLAIAASAGLGGLSRALQALGSAGNTQAAPVLGLLDSMPTAQAYRSAAQQLAPETNNASRRATQTGSNAVFSALENRIDNARGGALAGNPGGVAAGDGNRRAWLQGLGSWGEQDPRAGATGYKVGAAGVAGGIETDLAAREVMGVAVGYANAYTTGTGVATGDDARVDAFSAGAYFSRTEQDWTLDASMIAGFNSYKSERLVGIGGFNEVAHGDYDGWQVGGRVEVGFPFAMSPTWSGRWLVGARAGYVSTESYTETGNAAIIQNVDSSSATSFQPTLGVELNQAMSDQSRLQLRARYLHEMSNNPDIQATFVAGGPSFVTPGVKPNRDALQLGVGYRWATSEGSFVTLGYDAEFREQSLVNQVTARASWSF